MCKYLLKVRVYKDINKKENIYVFPQEIFICKDCVIKCGKGLGYKDRSKINVPL